MIKSLLPPYQRHRDPASSARSRGLDRRGAIGAAFAVGATALLGMGALATEAGVWLLARRNAQNAADVAAYGGVLVLSIRDSTAATNAATEIATLNGFTGDRRTTVTSEAGNWNGATGVFDGSATPVNAVRVSIAQAQATGLARLISSTVPIAAGTAIAVLRVGGPACVLSIPPGNPPGSLSTSQVDGSILITGSTEVSAPDCIFASNKVSRRSIEIGNNAADDLRVAGLRASGQCYGCADVPSGQLPGGYVSNSPPTPNPYADLDNRTLNPMSPLTCTPPVYYNAANQVVPWQNRNNPPRTQDYVTIRPAPRTPSSVGIPATCIDVSPSSGKTLDLTPGTYYFNEVDLTMSASSARITCTGCDAATGQGVTLVFTGGSSNSVGNLQITGGDFTLIAPGRNNGTPAIYDGVVLYRDILGDVSNAAGNNIRINGNSRSILFGGLYAPTSEIQVSGTSDMNPPSGQTQGCNSIVAARITFTGNSDVDIRACSSYGTDVARVNVVVLVR